MSYCKVCGKKLELTPEYDMCMECQGKQHRTFTIPNNRGSVSNKTEMSKEMTPKRVYMALLELGFEPFYLQSLSDDELLELKEKILVLKAKEIENE